MTSIKVDQRGAQAGGNIVAGDLNINYPTPELADPRIREDVEALRKRRWFAEYDRVGQARILARRLTRGALAAGSDEVRSRALAWCARILAGSDCVEEAEILNAEARRLASSSEAETAQAVILSKSGDKAAALSLLAKINDPAARSASLLIEALHGGAEGALSWAEKAALKPGDFDPEGMSVLLTRQLEIGLWNDAAATAEVVDSEANFSHCPLLHMSVALAYLLPAVPEEMRHVVRHQVPFQCKDFGLASDSRGMEFRSLARERFKQAAAVFDGLQLPRAAGVAEEYALWLSLEDPATNEEGHVRLRGFLRKLGESLRWVPFAAQYGEKLDIAAVEREVDRQTALNGGFTPEASAARLSLALMQQSPADVARYLSAHRDDLLKHVDPKAFAFIEIEILAKSGQRDLATEKLKAAHSLRLSPEEEARLQHIVDEAKASDVVAARRARFEATGALADLVPFVDLLAEEETWKDLVKYSHLLFERTKALAAAEHYVEASIKISQDVQALEFLAEYPGLLEQSEDLKFLKCWAQYREGLLLEAKQTLAELTQKRESQNYKSLRKNIAAALGDWNEISAIIAEEVQDKKSRTARELIQAAYLALRIRAPASKELLYAAVEKGQDDAALLASAYFLATGADWEDDPAVAGWLERAAKLSGDDGPILRTSLKEILARKPDWDRRESDTLRLLREGAVPIFLAAQTLNRSLIEVLSLPYLANLSEPDPRRRTPIPAFSGKRSVQNVDLGGVVGLEATSLLTLGALDLLDLFAESVGRIRIPHSTLGWLFEEKQRAGFHQPSRVRSAQGLQDLLVRRDVVEFAPTTTADSELSAQVGDDLARLITQAHASQGQERQQLVVRSAPVSRVGSLLEEEAELSAHAGVLVSCQAIVRKLRAEGYITGAEEKKAQAYLHLNEKEWQTQIEIESDAILYLADLSVTYFQAVGLLGKLKPAGFLPVVSAFKVREANAILSYQRMSDQVAALIEKIRAFLHQGILSQRILLSKIRDHLEKSEDERKFIDHPTVGAIAFASDCDAIVVDDRSINQHMSAGDGEGCQCPVLTTLDVMAALAASDRIAAEEATELRSRLRRGGYLFIDVSEEEVFSQLLASNVKEGWVVETAELKSIRESILLIRMSAHLQVPAELPWLDLMLKSLIKVLWRLWAQGEPAEVIWARADWVLGLIDIRGWLYCFEPNHALQLLNDGRAASVALLAHPPLDAGEDAIANYLEWADDRIFSPIAEQFPDLFAAIVRNHEDSVRQLWTSYRERAVDDDG